MTTERTAPPPRPADLEADAPDLDFRIGAGVYAGALLAVAAVIAAACLEASAAGVFAVLLTTFPLGAVLGAVVAGRVPGGAVAVGYSRRRRLALFVPAVAFGLLVVAMLLTATPGALVLAAFFAAGGTAGTALLLAVMARNRYVAAVAVDEPRATWTYRRSGPLRWEFAAGLCFLAMAIVYAAIGDRTFALLWAAQGGLWLIAVLGEGRWFDPDDLGYVPTLAVHDAGLVKSRGRTTALVPWADVADVRLTDDELVIDLENRFRSLRCDREHVDDPEAVRDAIDLARARAGPR